MKKISTQQILLSLFMSVLSCISLSESQAQCRYKAVNLANDTLSFTIPCDFPVKGNTGDSLLDENTFIAAFESWNQSSPLISTTLLPTIRFSGMKEVYFEISATDFALFTEERKTAILVYPQLYKIKP